MLSNGRDPKASDSARLKSVWRKRYLCMNTGSSGLSLPPRHVGHLHQPLSLHVPRTLHTALAFPLLALVASTKFGFMHANVRRLQILGAQPLLSMSSFSPCGPFELSSPPLFRHTAHRWIILSRYLTEQSTSPATTFKCLDPLSLKRSRVSAMIKPSLSSPASDRYYILDQLSIPAAKCMC